MTDDELEAMNREAASVLATPTNVFDVLHREQARNVLTLAAEVERLRGLLHEFSAAFNWAPEGKDPDLWKLSAPYAERLVEAEQNLVAALQEPPA